ncbi:TldD/PmbA family protein [Paenibacillus sp. OSY-SE]|uniref:TldD/PmbA family protein n=1 Tax=Paenibacillus sp. OSY-SE TaxID=1196323 RepID=UPI00030ED0F2|nr:TldD/PmbA family protein [Paenibacillus sp. OSY-SE]
MDVTQFQQHLFAKGIESGCSNMEIYYEQVRSTTVRVSKGEIDAYTIKESGGLSFRGEFASKIGYAYSEQIDERVIDYLIEEARNNAEVMESEENDELFAGSASYPELTTYSERLTHVAPQALIDAALEMESVAVEADSRIVMVRSSSVTISESEVLIANTRGLDCRAKYSSAVGSISVVARDAADTTTGEWYDFSLQDFDEINFADIARKSVHEAVSKLNADTIASDNYPVIFRNDAASTLLNAYTTIFSAEAVDKDFSRLKGKLGEQVAGSNITIVDDPLMPHVPAQCAFDAEGHATRRNEIIKEGKLLTFLHNGKTAKKSGIDSTGHASKGGYHGKIGIAPHNLYVEPGTVTLEEMIADTGRGLMIVQLQGLHAGTNAVSGEFSLSCIGFLIEAGKVKRPVNQITVSGNLFNVLNEIEEVGNDLRFTGKCNSPSLKIKSLTISGA